MALSVYFLHDVIGLAPVLDHGVEFGDGDANVPFHEHVRNSDFGLFFYYYFVVDGGRVDVQDMVNKVAIFESEHEVVSPVQSVEGLGLDVHDELLGVETVLLYLIGFVQQLVNFIELLPVDELLAVDHQHFLGADTEENILPHVVQQFEHTLRLLNINLNVLRQGYFIFAYLAFEVVLQHLVNNGNRIVQQVLQQCILEEEG